MSFISVEGNIGAGKSTLVNLLKDELNKFIIAKFLQEPVDKWLLLKNSSDENILELFYNNQERWAYSFQMNAFHLYYYRMKKELYKLWRYKISLLI